MLWWRRINETSLGSIKNGLNSLVILGALTLWKHHNWWVFDGMPPCLVDAITQPEEERNVWELAGAKGISFLMALMVGCLELV
jgi:hypothetical protein